MDKRQKVCSEGVLTHAGTAAIVAVVAVVPVMFPIVVHGTGARISMVLVSAFSVVHHPPVHHTPSVIAGRRCAKGLRDGSDSNS